MTLSIKDYRKMNADPKRSEAAQRGAWKRHLREKTHRAMMKSALRDGYQGSKVDFIKSHSPIFDDLLDTKWSEGDV